MPNKWMFKYRDEFESILKESNVDKSEVCIVGSMTLSYFDLREPNDLDFCTLPKHRNKFDTDEDVTVPGIYPITDQIELKSEYLYRIGGTDTEIIRNDKYHLNIDGFKIIRPELLLAYKEYRGESKDITLLKKLSSEWESWEPQLVEQYRGGPSLPRRAIRSVLYFGMWHTLREGKEKIIGKRL